MLERKSKVTEDVREEKQHYRGCDRGKVKSRSMLEREKKVPEDVQEEKQRDSGCYGGRATLQS